MLGQRDMYRKLKQVTRSASNLGVTFITVIDENGISKDITEKEQMEKAIMEENVHKYHQTEATCPFLKEPLKSEFGQYREKEKTYEVTEGDYEIPEGIDQYTRDFIKVCARKEEDKLTDMERTPMEFKNSWEKMKEKPRLMDLYILVIIKLGLRIMQS